MIIVALFLINILFVPIVISEEFDPITIYPNQDSFISEKNRNTNYGSINYTKINSKYGITNNTYWENYGLIRFDLSSIPSGMYVISAKLYLYYYGFIDNDPAGRILTVYRIGENWDETTVNWNYRPINAGKITASSTIPDDYEYMIWNLTVDVQDYINNNWDNHGWKICDENSWGGVNIPTSLFYSKNNNEKKPYLVVKYQTEKPNNLPISDPGGPYNGYINEPVKFDVSNSSDSDGIITGYRWDFDNDSNWDTNWTTSNITYHTYNKTSNNTVVLQVIDNKSSKTQNSTWVNVTVRPNEKPDTDFSFNPYYPNDGEEINFTDRSTDSDGSVSSWLWDFGDGNTSTSQNPKHTYSNTGNYTVKLSVIDNDGGMDNESKNIQVIDYLRGDINQNGTVDLDDLIILLNYIFDSGEKPSPVYYADINGDGEINYKDLFV